MKSCKKQQVFEQCLQNPVSDDRRQFNTAEGYKGEREEWYEPLTLVLKFMERNLVDQPINRHKT